MSNNRLFYYLAFGVSAVMLAAAIFIFAEAADIYLSGIPALSSSASHKVNRAMSAIDKALKLELPGPSKTFLAPERSPFGIENTGSAKKSRIRAPTASQYGLLLKGVLQKDKPLAILQNQAGETFICTKGDTVCGMCVTSIQIDMVEITGKGGRLKLTIPEAEPSR